MSYNPNQSNHCPINEAFSDPINERKMIRGDMVFKKHEPTVYTQPLHFPNYLNQYTPNHPAPPGPGENYNYYPRSNLNCNEFTCTRK
jgi:hypothetical protein